MRLVTPSSIVPSRKLSGFEKVPANEATARHQHTMVVFVVVLVLVVLVLVLVLVLVVLR